MKLPVWLKDTIERSVRTWIQAFLGVAGYTGIETCFDQIHWFAAAEAATIATIFALLMAFGASALPIGQPGTASTIDLEPAASVPAKAARASRRQR